MPLNVQHIKKLNTRSFLILQMAFQVHKFQKEKSQQKENTYILHQQGLEMGFVLFLKCKCNQGVGDTTFAEEHQQPHYCSLQQSPHILSFTSSQNASVKYSRRETHILRCSSVCGKQSNSFCGGVSFRSHTPQTQRQHSSMVSCWSRTYSTAVHRTCDYIRHVGGPSGTS